MRVDKLPWKREFFHEISMECLSHGHKYGPWHKQLIPFKNEYLYYRTCERCNDVDARWE
jgi:hypothetical protein